MYEEINDFIRKSKEGHKESKEKLLESLKPLIITSIRKYYNKPNEYEDLIQEGRILILECLDSYDDTKGTYFLGYVKHMLMYHYLGKNKQKIFVSLNEKIGEDGDEERIDLLISDDESLLNQIIILEDREEVNEALLTLTLRQRGILYDFYFRNMKNDEIAAKRGISYRTVVNTRTKAINKLRKFFGGVND